MKRAAALCARSEQSPRDVMDKLLKWGLTGTDAQKVLQQLVEQGFVDIKRYARAFVKDRYSLNGWGRIKIAHQLYVKGIADDIIAQALEAIDEQQYCDRLLESLRVKWRAVKGREPRAAWAAMMRFAVSRGYETDIAARCVKQITRLDDQQD